MTTLEEKAEARRKQRQADVLALDDLPAELRQAIRSCDWPIYTPIMRRGLDVRALAQTIRAVRSDADAREVNQLIVHQINSPRFR